MDNLNTTQTVQDRIANILDQIAEPLLDRYDFLLTHKAGNVIKTTPAERAKTVALHIMPPPDGLRRRTKPADGTPSEAPAIHTWPRFHDGRLHLSIHPDSIVTGSVDQIAGSLLCDLALFAAHGPQGPQPVPKIVRDKAGNEIQKGTTLQMYTAEWKDAAALLGIDTKAGKRTPEPTATAKLREAISQASRELVPFIGAKPKGAARATYAVELIPYHGKTEMPALTDDKGQPFRIPVGEDRAVNFLALSKRGIRFKLVPYVKPPAAGAEFEPLDDAAELLAEARERVEQRSQERAERKAAKEAKAKEATAAEAKPPAAEKKPARKRTPKSKAPETAAPVSDVSDLNE